MNMANRPTPLALQCLATGAWQAAVPSDGESLKWQGCLASPEPVLAAALLALQRSFGTNCWRTLAWLIGDSRLRPELSPDAGDLVMRLSARIRDSYWAATVNNTRVSHTGADADAPPRKRPRPDDDASAGGAGLSGRPVRN